MKLEIRGLRASVEGKEILKGIDLTLESGEINALMGPNGSGKSTLANVLLGHPNYEVLGGEVLVDGTDILGLSTYRKVFKTSNRAALSAKRENGYLRISCRSSGKYDFPRDRSTIYKSLSE